MVCLCRYWLRALPPKRYCINVDPADIKYGGKKLAIDITILLGLNLAIFATVIVNTLRIGKLQGRLENGDFLRCPFYRAKRCESNDKRGHSGKGD